MAVSSGQTARETELPRPLQLRPFTSPRGTQIRPYAHRRVPAEGTCVRRGTRSDSAWEAERPSSSPSRGAAGLGGKGRTCTVETLQKRLQSLPNSTCSDVTQVIEINHHGKYDLVSAYEVDHRGDYVSHEIMHHQRRRRAVAQLAVDSLHLWLKGFRHNFQMDLKASSNLVAPGFIVQTLGKGGTKSVQTFSPEDFCFYQGSLRYHRNSSVALSTCQGLSGMIRTEEADYFLKPLPSHLAGTVNSSASHVLYKRSVGPLPARANEVMVTARKRELPGQPLHGGSFHLGLPQKQHFCGRRKK
ncbi:PREDICTED: A disintegrin and metalloproteinase with thrombospondin motifs 16-like, partial [Galeopterus variegatus]|uniref:A disintegrin and metalloproteinase with thrombospondin motifs 16-like n=1 Tax=Galeopterus variegatus TaxID=482537 RepID=A0ABM0RN59_GALVR